MIFTRKFLLILMGMLTLSVLPVIAAGCQHGPPKTLTPLPQKNDIQAINDFLSAAKDRYREGITCGGHELKPSLDVSEELFLSLSVASDTWTFLDKQPFAYVVIPKQLGYIRGTISLLDYTIAFDDPEPGVTRTGGGLATLTRVYQNKRLVGQKTFYDQVFNILEYSAEVRSLQIGDVKVFSIAYLLDCSHFQAMTIVLAPAPAPSPAH